MANEPGEYTIGGVKPSAVKEGKRDKILDAVSESGLEIVDQKEMVLTTEEANAIYPKQYNLQEDLVRHAASGLWTFFLARGDSAMDRLRRLMGTSRLVDRPARGIRGEYGVDKIRNAIHGTSNPHEIESHLKLIFPDSTLDVQGIEFKPMNDSSRQETPGYHGEIITDKKARTLTKVMYYSMGQFPDLLFREYMILCYIADLGIGPKPLAYCTETEGSDELQMEFIEGLPWNDLGDKSKKNQLPIVGGILSRLHLETRQHGHYEAAGKRRSGNYVDCFEDNLRILLDLSEKYRYSDGIEFIHKYRRALLGKVEKSGREESNFSLIHFDASPGNVILAAKELRLVDWGSAHFNDPALDLARTIEKLTDGTPASIRLLTRDYVDKSKTLPRAYVYLPLAFLSTAIGRSVHRDKKIPQRAALRDFSQKQIYDLAEFHIRMLVEGTYD